MFSAALGQRFRFPVFEAGLSCLLERTVMCGEAILKVIVLVLQTNRGTPWKTKQTGLMYVEFCPHF